MNFYNIIQGDCFEIFSKLKDESIDFVITSPPFKEKEVPGEYYAWFGKLLENLDRITNFNSFIFNSSTRLIDICRKFKPQRILVWAKTGIKPSYRYEPIFIFEHRKGFNISRRIWSDCLIFRPTLKPEIPYTNPIELYLRLIEMVTKEGDVILDPFLGSGTTMVACKKLGRSCIGIEINPEFCKLAQKRVDGTNTVKALSEVFG